MLALVVAAAQNGVIGRDNQLPWHLSADLKRFRALTMGHHILMGRKTFESIGRPLPGRTNIVIPRQPDFRAEGVVVTHSLAEALALAADDDQIFVVGGAEIYRQALPQADRIYLTIIHQDFEGDTLLFDLDKTVWRETSRVAHLPDEKNPYPYSFVELERKQNG
ncbi:MAG TPA: dihydrofolate reductase [Anaerolineae bacterium]|nr:dihydrofolate reductase [Anaerolineae bacterium]